MRVASAIEARAVEMVKRGLYPAGGAVGRRAEGKVPDNSDQAYTSITMFVLEPRESRESKMHKVNIT